MKILTIIGARPQFVKAAMVSRAIAGFGGINEVIVHTGQHFDRKMSDVFFKEMDIPEPHYNLDINSLSHGAMTGRMIESIEEVLKNENPDILLVYGDTNSTIAGALAAKKLMIKVAHVEAGLRSFNYAMPEEINRILTDRISDYLFCPTEAAVNNLEREGFLNFPSKISLSGDVMFDAAVHYREISLSRENILGQLGLKGKPYGLVTIHRQENTLIEKLPGIIEALNKINQKLPLVFPVHPRTRKMLDQMDEKPQFIQIEPVGYLDMIALIQSSQMVLTDSGGLQKEAFFFQKPCLTLRTETEWVELTENGLNIVVGDMKTGNIIEKFEKLSNLNIDFNVDLYGNGKAAGRIVKTLME